MHVPDTNAGLEVSTFSDMIWATKVNTQTHRQAALDCLC